MSEMDEPMSEMGARTHEMDEPMSEMDDPI